MTDRKCCVCDEFHDSNVLCPIVEKKIKKLSNKSNSSNIISNIILKCLQKHIDFEQILEELLEYGCYSELNNQSGASFDILIDYFALSIGCTKDDFNKDNTELEREYTKLLQSRDFSCIISEDFDMIMTEEGQVLGYAIAYENTYMYSNDIFYSEPQPIFYLMKNCKKTTPEYALRLFLRRKIYDDNLLCNEKLKLMQMLYDGIGILLINDKHGGIKELFENEMDWIWNRDIFVVYLPYSDERMPTWINKISNATKGRIIEWRKYTSKYSDEVTYYSNIKEHDIVIKTNIQDSCSDRELLYIRLRNGKSLCFGRKIPVCEGVLENVNSSQEILGLVKTIEYQIMNMDILKPTLPDKLLEKHNVKSSDVIVITHAMYCKNSEHTVYPCIGLVPILTNDNVETVYEIYLGYCKECNQHYMFEQDYKRMLAVGKPLCKVYEIYEYEALLNNSEFKYNSQSVLNSMGYNVDASIALVTDERHRILMSVIDNNMIRVHELIDFLYWLIRTRETQPKYDNAVKKWKEDVIFVENYSSKVEKTEVDAISIKRHIKY